MTRMEWLGQMADMRWSILACQDHQIIHDTLTWAQYRILRLEAGLRRIQEYHESNHRTPMPGGTTKLCETLLKEGN